MGRGKCKGEAGFGSKVARAGGRSGRIDRGGAEEEGRNAEEDGGGGEEEEEEEGEEEEGIGHLGIEASRKGVSGGWLRWEMPHLSTQPDSQPLAIASVRAWVVFVATIVVSVVVDLVTKYWAFAWVAGRPVRVVREEVVAVTPKLWQLIPAHQPRVVVPHVLEFTLVLNPGAVFGIGAGKRWFFVVFTGIAVAIGAHAFARWTRRGDWAMHVAIGLILGGGLGNLYDRLVYACVRDFIHPLPGVMYPFGISTPWSGREVWPYVSNVADALLLVGVGMIVWRSLRVPGQAGASRGRGAGNA